MNHFSGKEDKVLQVEKVYKNGKSFVRVVFLDELVNHVLTTVRHNPFWETFDITPAVMKLGSFTVVHLRAVGKSFKPDQEYEALGFARKSKKDKDNPVLAEQIAKGRAMKALEIKIRGYAIDKKYMG